MTHLLVCVISLVLSFHAHRTHRTFLFTNLTNLKWAIDVIYHAFMNKDPKIQDTFFILQEDTRYILIFYFLLSKFKKRISSVKKKKKRKEKEAYFHN